MILQTFAAGREDWDSETFALGAEDELVVHAKAVSLVNEYTCCESETRRVGSQGNKRLKPWHTL
jgi:hypothetical protein